jgi:N-acetylneuraminic acid mutarotase
MENQLMNKTFGSILVGFITLAATLALTTSAYAQGKWVKLAPFPEPAEEVLGAAAGGKVYVFAGLLPGYKPAGMVYEYDPATDQWTKKKPMALPSHHVAIAESGGKIYAFGGFVLPKEGPPAWQPIDNAWEYDPAADTWKALAPMPSKRGAGVAAAVGGKLYVIGGATTAPGAKDPGIVGPRPHSVVGTTEEYDPATNTWRVRSPMPTPRNHAAVGAVNGKIYVIGGRIGAAFITGNVSNIDVVEEYDPATDTWGPPRARMPTARSAVAYAVRDGRIYVAGGEYQDARLAAAYRVLEEYNPATNEWINLPRMPLQRHGLAGAVVGNRLHLISGDVQSAGSGLTMHTPAHDAFEFAK